MEGKAITVVARGNCIWLMHVEDVGRNPSMAGMNLIDGCNSNPNKGSSSIPVTKDNILPKNIFSRRPPKNKFKKWLK